MNRFGTVRKAKEYLIRRIVAQADQDGIPLSDIERKMLYFSETGWTLPNMMAISQEFDEKYDQNEYETKIGQIVRRMHEQPDSNGDDDWYAAAERLADEDHYLTVLINGDSSGSEELSRWDKVRLFLTGAVIMAIFLPVIFFLDSHIANTAVSQLIGGGAFLALVVLGVHFGNRAHRRKA